MKNRDRSTIIRQFVPSEVCLKCQGCCRYAEQHSVWAPCLLEEEIQEMADADIPAVSISLDKRLCVVPNASGDGYLCPFLDAATNKCKLYARRPFECQLYPFLISVRQKKVLLTVDTNCTYVSEHLKTAAFKEYTEYLADFLNAPAQRKLLLGNPQLIQAYEEVLSVLELDL